MEGRPKDGNKRQEAKDEATWFLGECLLSAPVREDSDTRKLWNLERSLWEKKKIKISKNKSKEGF